MLKVQISATHGKGLVIPYGSFSGENWLEKVARSPYEEQASRPKPESPAKGKLVLAKSLKRQKAVRDRYNKIFTREEKPSQRD